MHLETQESCSVQATDISALVFQHEIWMKIVFASIFVTKTFMFKIVLLSLFCIIMKLCVIFSPIVYLANTQSFVDIFVHIQINN